MLTINTNLSSLIAQNSLKTSTNNLNLAIERMTTGFKINHAKDNAANYSIATNMDTKIGAYQVAEENAMMGLDMVNTASSTLDLISEHLQRLRDLAVQASNGTYGADSMKAINAEANARVDEIERLYDTAEYNGIKLLNTQSLVDSYIPEDLKPKYNGFIKEIVKRDTSAMIKFATVNPNSDLTDGTYSISTPEELKKLADMTNAGLVSAGDEFVLANDIDLSQYENWTSIGTYEKSVDGVKLTEVAFKGKLDGNGFVISNLKMKYEDNKYKCLALFGVTSNNAEIKNLAVKNINISSNSGAASLVGISQETTIDNCYVSEGSVSSNALNSSVGGLIGDSVSVNILNCYSDIKINSPVTVGGLSGYARYITIENSFTMSQISKTKVVSSAGLIGNCQRDVTITNSAVINKQDSLRGVFLGNVMAGATVDVQNCYYNSYYDDNNIPLIGQNKDPATSTITIDNVTKIETPNEERLLQIGINGNKNSQIKFDSEFIMNSVGYLRSLGIADVDYVTYLDSILAKLAKKQTNYGSVQNRLESALDEISTQYENLVSSRSTLRDADIAEVSSEYIRQQILQQASATLLATANQSPSIALQLI